MKNELKTARVEVLDESSGEYAYLGIIDDGTDKTSGGTCYLGYFRFLEIDKSKLNNNDVRRMRIDHEGYFSYVDYQIYFYRTHDHTFNITRSSYVCEPNSISRKRVDKKTGEVKIYGDWED